MWVAIRNVAWHRRVVKIIAPRLNRICGPGHGESEMRTVILIRVVPSVHRLWRRVRPRRGVPVNVRPRAQAGLVKHAEDSTDLVAVARCPSLVMPLVKRQGVLGVRLD